MLEIQLVFVLCIHIYENVPRALKPYVFLPIQEFITLWKMIPFKYIWQFPVGVRSHSWAIWISVLLTSYYVVITFSTNLIKRISQQLMLLFFAHIMKFSLLGISKYYLKSQVPFLEFLVSLIKNLRTDSGSLRTNLLESKQEKHIHVGKAKFKSWLPRRAEWRRTKKLMSFESSIEVWQAAIWQRGK